MFDFNIIIVVNVYTYMIKENLHKKTQKNYTKKKALVMMIK